MRDTERQPLREMSSQHASSQQNTQTASDRRALRKELRTVFADVKDNQEQLCAVGNKKLENALDKVNELHGSVARIREHALDAEVFTTLAEACHDMARKSQQAQQGLGPSDLVAALALRYAPSTAATELRHRPEAFRWVALGRDSRRHFRSCPGVNCMLGPMDAVAKVRKAPVRRARQAVAAQTAPEAVAAIAAAGDQQETDRNMEEMWRLLRDRPDTQVLPLVLNHASFAQTVENLFTLSFLVRDQRVRLFTDPERGLMVKSISKAETSALAAQHREAVQFVVELSMADWRKMKVVVPPHECIMRHRAADGGAPAAQPGS